ncbi:MAG: hypothetical protein JNJ99_16070 [Crocinitomicaceae bacterium]|nr:hypothetical protein [Crocinitomicaceae bacterium]
MKNLLLISIIGTGLIFTGCKKDEVPPPAPTSNLSNVFNDNLDDAKQSFTINASTYNQFTGANGVIVAIPANSFEDASGNIISGNVSIQLIEILDQSSMILMGMPTTSNGDILVSGGQMNLTATQNGNIVYLADNAYVSVMVPTTQFDYNMQLFDGVAQTDGSVDWILSTDDSTGFSDSVSFVPDSTGGGFFGGYYGFNWTDSTLGWINLDYFYYSGASLTNMTVDLAADYTASNTAVFLHFSNINSVASVYNNGTDFVAYDVPENEAVTIVCISEISGQYYSAFVPVTITTNLVVPVTMNATTLTDIETAINNL